VRVIPKGTKGPNGLPIDGVIGGYTIDALHLLLFVGLCIFFALLLFFIQARQFWRNGYTLPARARPGEATNNVLVLGIGGAGKTSVIRALTGNVKANPDARTNEFDVHPVSFVDQSVPGKEKTKTLRLADYKGQNLSTLIAGFCRLQLQPYSPLRWGHVASVLIVVDLFEPTDTGSGNNLTRAAPDSKRIQKNVANWVPPVPGGTSVLDAVFGLVTEDVRLVCIFINKVDKLQSYDDQMRHAIEDEFRDIRIEIEKRPLKCKVEFRSGSAETGLGIVGRNGLRDLLFEHAR
jgi:hypothetical protein